MEITTPPAVWTMHTTVVVVGTGAAGLSALLPLLSAGVECIAVTRGAVTDSATALAQGGLAAVWSPDDTLESHIADTLTAGAGLCDPGAVRELVAAAPEAIRRLAALGAQFDRDETGDYDLHLEGGHSQRRIVHAQGDASGAEVERALHAALSAVLGTGHDAEANSALSTDNSSRVLEHTRLIDLLTDDSGRAVGVRVVDQRGEIGEIFAYAVVLASGGFGQLWRATSNPAVATGDGLAAALRAGAIAQDLEFVQFHPTVFAGAQGAAGASAAGSTHPLISEAVRGEGAILVDSAGTSIMQGVHPLADLAPRDIVSAAVMEHLERTGAPCVWLDATAFGEETWQHKFPSILRVCRERGVDPVTEPIPVLPAAHYTCGGIRADLTGRTNVPGLFAIGEVASTGVQGANRLASNSVTEALVAGHQVGEYLAETLRDISAADTQELVAVQRTTVEPVADTHLAGLTDAMQMHAFVQRDRTGLQELQQVISAGTCGTDATASAPVTATKQTLTETSLTASNLHLIAQALVTAALQREESRGCHRRREYTDPRPEWQRRVGVQLIEGEIATMRILTTSATDRPVAPGPQHTTHSDRSAA